DIGHESSVATAHDLCKAEVGYVKARRKDNRVNRVKLAVNRNDAVRPHLVDAGGDHVDIRLRDRWIPIVGGEDALAAQRVVRLQPRAQLGAGDLLLEVALRHPLRQLHQPWPVDEARDEQLAAQVDRRSNGSLQRGEATVDEALDLGDRAVAVRHDPWGRPLEDVEMFDDRLDLWNHLNRRSTGADHG